MITWKMNEWGNIKIWRGEYDVNQSTLPKADLYLQTDIDVKAFLKNIGLSQETVTAGQWGFAEAPDYFQYDPKEDDEDW
jgi:hypothetical protein